MLSPAVMATLLVAARTMNGIGVEWVIFGGAAMALHGFKAIEVNDIDIITSNKAAMALMGLLSIENQADKFNPRFRSDYLLHPSFGEIPVEVLGSFRIYSEGRWQVVLPQSVVKFSIGEETVFVPAVNELIAIFELCGRPKDLERIRLLRSAQ